MITFHQVECPKCHGQLNSITPLSGQYICPFCGTDFHITANMAKETEAPGQIVPFTTSSEEFEQAVCQMLINEEYAPVNISGLSSVRNVRGFYLPVYLYEGRYEYQWQCKVKQAPPDAGATDARKDQAGVYCQQNGVSKDDYAFVCLAYDGVESSKELAEYICSLDYKSNGMKPFRSENLEGHFFLACNQNSQKTWGQWGKGVLNNIAQKNALIQLQNNDIKDFKCDVSPDLVREGLYAFFPVWMVNYQYDGALHHIFMSGTDGNSITGSPLIDHTLKTKAEKPFTILKIIAVAAIVIPLLMVLANWYLPAIIALVAMGLVFFGYRYYARWHKGKVIRKARKEREKSLINF